MSNGIVARREFLAAAQALVKTNAPDIQHLEAVTKALSQIITADTGIECKVVLKMSAAGIKQLLGKTQ